MKANVLNIQFSSWCPCKHSICNSCTKFKWFDVGIKIIFTEKRKKQCYVGARTKNDFIKPWQKRVCYDEDLQFWIKYRQSFDCKISVKEETCSCSIKAVVFIKLLVNKRTICFLVLNFWVSADACFKIFFMSYCVLASFYDIF